MAHSFHGKSCNIHYNSDMSGELHIIRKDTNEEIKVDAEDILELIANYVRGQRISEIEDMDWKNILGINKPVSKNEKYFVCSQCHSGYYISLKDLDMSQAIGENVCNKCSKHMKP